MSKKKVHVGDSGYQVSPGYKKLKDQLKRIEDPEPSIITKKKVVKKLITTAQTSKPKPCSGSQDVNTKKNPYLTMSHPNLFTGHQIPSIPTLTPTPLPEPQNSPRAPNPTKNLKYLRMQQSNLQNINNHLNRLTSLHNQTFQDPHLTSLCKNACNSLQKLFFSKLQLAKNLTNLKIAKNDLKNLESREQEDY